LAATLPFVFYPAVQLPMVSFANWLSICIWIVAVAGCAAKVPVHSVEVDDLGRFEYREPNPGMSGIVIGAPHGGSAPATAALAQFISERTGAGFIVAYGFQSKRISVEEPVERSYWFQRTAATPSQRRSVFAEFTTILKRMTHGSIDFYFGIRHRPAVEQDDRMQVIASGFTVEEAEVIKESFAAARDRAVGLPAVEKLSISLDPVEPFSWREPGLLHHGILMLAERGLSVRVPARFLTAEHVDVLGDILSAWIKEIEHLVKGKSRSLPQAEITVMDLGRIDMIPSRKAITGVVIGAPHGSYDEYTAELVKQLGLRTSLATVIARGFTPTEAGGWRINVNRPSEMSYVSKREVNSLRSRKIFDAFKQIVVHAAGGELRLYVDVHQYGTDDTIQIATVGVDSQQAARIKRVFQRARDRLLMGNAGIDRVELLIEPLDSIEIGAWAAKYNGILAVARKSLHIELPLQSALRNQKSRELYTKAVSELLAFVLHELGESADSMPSH